MDTLTIWNNLYDERLKWAYEARIEFYNSIEDRDIKEIYKNASKEIYVCVYGRSQVGKTTLILKLIGIKDKYIKKVSDILRGKRKIGNSATITATIYTAAEDDYFYYEEIKDEVKKCTEERIKEVLKDLRERACCGGVSTNSIKISIPKKYFEVRKNKKNINIIDLPGVESDDLTEYEHVEKITKKFVPVSNMILLIERADQVAYLQKLKLPGIDYWYNDVDRFKVILTRSVSNNSTKKEILSKNITEKMEYVKLFEEDIRKDNKEIELKEKMVYPLEYGESWDELKNKESEMVLKISPIFDILYAELEEEVIKSQNEYSKLMMSMQMYNRIEKNILVRRNNYKKEISKEENFIRVMTNKVFAIETGIKLIETEREDLLEKIILLEEIGKMENLCKLEIEKASKENTLELNEYLNSASVECNSKYTKKISEINYKFEELGIIESIRNNTMNIFWEEISVISEKLESYWIERYFRTSKFREDKASAENAVEKAEHRIVEGIKKEKEKIVLRYIETFRCEEEALKKTEKFERRRIEKAKNEIKRLERKRESKKQELKEYIEQSKKDLKLSTGYLEFLYRAYAKKAESIKRKIENKKINNEERIANLIYLYLISDELNKLEETLK